MLSNMSGYPQGFDETKYMSFLNMKSCWKLTINGKIKINIWDKISNIIGKGFDSETVYDEKYLKAKLNLMATK